MNSKRGRLRASKYVKIGGVFSNRGLPSKLRIFFTVGGIYSWRFKVFSIRGDPSR